MIIPPATGIASPMACAMGKTVWASLKNFALREVDGPGTALSTDVGVPARVTEG